MMQKITLTIDGKAKTFHQLVTARMCRTAYMEMEMYNQSFAGNKQKINEQMMDRLVRWLVESYGAQFTEEQFWDGYQGSFMEILQMMREIIMAVSDAVVEFPKKMPEAAM